MIPDEYNLSNFRDALGRGGVGDLRFACDFADRIVTAVGAADDEETLKKGFKAFRARADYEEDCTSNPGNVYLNPLIGK